MVPCPTEGEADASNPLADGSVPKPLVLGSGKPVQVQTMWNKPLEEKQVTDGFISELEQLVAGGCNLIRFSTPSIVSVKAVGMVAQRLSIPVIADIHYDYRIALECLKYPIAKLRLNPGNIGEMWRVKEVARAANDKGVAIRIGVNGGSMPSELDLAHDAETRQEWLEKSGRNMLQAAVDNMEALASVAFDNIVVSLKASDPALVVYANELFAKDSAQGGLGYPFPLHLGVTEAGPLTPSLIKSTLAFSKLLEQGIGDTIRISISGEPREEVLAGAELLRSLGLRKGINLISCPGCARSTFDTAEFTAKLQNKMPHLPVNMDVAVMGCPVNGPGEAKHADLAISGAGLNVSLFSKGKLLKNIPSDGAEDVLIREIEKMAATQTETSRESV
ncbi:(E)-4-hydroxy-3-methylbut-2-enyl-diphosphate synthase [Candidatus Haliotispira prima]|uniref:4-hydroxy-3-methylbut-2-en-1-yl diphosphate synthase (flavodoxin) n=2 Tax=Candidatus Haliotispira prima TaxID=3034016 RepID=A0ABY8MKS9_9SPIO|nr:(E)-4-hydroxy-3-methylbut-2-enyl-diphosphate synthase [Candidatus Haliotispira prima]